MDHYQNGNAGYLNIIKKRIKNASVIAFNRTDVANNEIVSNDKLNAITKIVYKLLPLPIRIRIRKNNYELLKREIRDLLGTKKDVIDRDALTATDRNKSGSSFIENKDSLKFEEKILKYSVVDNEEIVTKGEDTKVEPKPVAEESMQEAKHIVENKSNAKETSVNGPTEKPVKHIIPETHTEKSTTTYAPARTINYVKFVIIGASIIVLIIAVYFIKSFLSKPSTQSAITQESKPFQSKKTIKQRTTTKQQVESKPFVPVNGTSNMTQPERLPEKVMPEQKQKPPVAVPKSVKEQETNKSEKKSFAPPSRDDF